MIGRLGVMAAVAVLAGLVGFLLARSGPVVLVGPIAERVPRGRHVAFPTDLWAHSASYATALPGGVFLAWRTWRWRSAWAPVGRERPGAGGARASP